MSKYKFYINGIQFNSKTSLIEYIRSQIYREYKNYENLSNDHLSFMVDLLRYHDHGDQKVGIGVRRMWIQPNGKYHTPSFWLERIDGTETDFSFHQCVSPPSVLRDFNQACRAAVATTVVGFRHEYFEKNSVDNKIICPLSKKSISIYETHVDHAPPYTFENIFNQFIRVKKIQINVNMLEDHSDGKIGNRLKDKKLEMEWIVFHNERASLRCLSRESNLAI